MTVLGNDFKSQTITRSNKQVLIRSISSCKAALAKDLTIGWGRGQRWSPLFGVATTLECPYVNYHIDWRRFSQGGLNKVSFHKFWPIMSIVTVLHDGQLKNSPRFCVHWDILLKILQIEATHVSHNQHIFKQVSMFMTGRLDHILDFCSTFIFSISPFQWKCTPHISSKKPMECHAAKYGVMSPSPAIFVCFWSWNTSSIVISEFWIMLLAYLVPCLE